MERNIKKNIIIISLATSMSASAALVPVLSSISEAFPNWESYIQLLVTIPPLMIMISSLLVNPLLKRFSDKKLSVFGLLLIIFSGVYPYFSNSFPLLLLSRVIMGIGLGFVTTISSSLPAGYFEIGEDRDKATGLQSAFSSFGGILFSLFSGFVANYYWKGVFLVQLLNLIPLIFVLLFMKSNESFKLEDNPVEKNIQSGKIFVKEALPYTILAFLCVTITVTFPLNLSLFVKDRNIGTTNLAAIIASVNSLIGFLVGFIFYKINELTNNKSLPLSLFLVGISLLIISNAYNPIVFFIGSSLFGIGTSLIYPAFLTNIYADISNKNIVAAIAMYTVSTNIAQFVSPFIINNIAKIFGNTIMIRFNISAIGVFILGFIILIYFSNHNKLETNKRR